MYSFAVAALAAGLALGDAGAAAAVLALRPVQPRHFRAALGIDVGLSKLRCERRQ